MSSSAAPPSPTLPPAAAPDADRGEPTGDERTDEITGEPAHEGDGIPDGGPAGEATARQNQGASTPGRGWLGRSKGLWNPGVDRSADDTDVTTIEAWQRAQERSRSQARVRANQRAARQMQRLRTGGGAVEVPVTGTPGPAAAERPGSVRPLGLVAGGLLALVVGVTGYLFIGLGSTGSPTTEPSTATSGDPSGRLDLTVGAAVPPATPQQLALSTVQVVGLDEDMNPRCAGSGVIVTADGIILTNAHVVRSSVDCRFSSLGVAVTVDPSQPPELVYGAQVEAIQLDVDLAVLRIIGPLIQGDASWPATFPAAPLGDSDTVELGDPVRIIGYPMIGGETITLTTGTVSGFTSQAGVGSRALIKTDATIAAGNSGGLAVDAEGRVIGIPTKARASEGGPAIDCRPINDTNGDGEIDGDDTCVPVGGFLNGIRPINLSLGLLAAAGASDPANPDVAHSEPGPVDLDEVELFNPRFSLAMDADGGPAAEQVTASAGVDSLCFFVDGQGRLPSGTSWDGVWYVDSMAVSRETNYIESAGLEAQRSHRFGLCLEAGDGTADGAEEVEGQAAEGMARGSGDGPGAGLKAGVYELAFYLGGQLAFVEGFEITAEPVEVVSVEWVNRTGVPLCELAINPLADLKQIGINELPRDMVIAPDEHWIAPLPVGPLVVVEATDCNGEVVANNFGGDLTASADPVPFYIDPD